jgi:TM2 domain-containing membrane protein YozV
MFCSKCGKQIPDDSVFCPECGAKVGVDQPEVVYTPDNEKSGLAAGLFGILLGGFGVHNFYLGFVGKGVVQLVLTLLVVTWPVSWIWGLIEGLMILTGTINKDASGRPIKKDF